MRVLIVDDDDIALDMLKAALLNWGYQVETASNGAQALEKLRTGLYPLVISDWNMPEMSGIELCRRIRQRHYCGYIYIVLLTSREEKLDVIAGLEAGADDYLCKPFDPTELCMRLRVGQRLLALESRNVTIFALAKLAESRDPETGAHLERMREYCRILAQHLSEHPDYRDQVDADYVESIYLTSPLHDIGKVGVPDSVLLKPGRLTDREFEVMKTHTLIGAETLSAASQQNPEAGFLTMARDIALTHHERFDGAGYPQGLTGDEIPLSGRIVALADAYDALTTKRVYKNAFSHDVAKAIICDDRDTHFDPVIVDSFLAAEEEFMTVRKSFEDSQPADYATNLGEPVLM